MLYTVLTFIFGESQTLEPQLGGSHECMHACMVEQATTKPDHNTPLSLNIWAADCFPHRVLEHSKPQNGVSHLLTTSTSSMRRSILTFSPTEDADIFFSAKKISARALHSDPDL